MPKLGLIVAMRAEVPPILKAAAGVDRIGNNTVKVAVSGIGLQRARHTTQQVCGGSLGFYPDMLVSLGFCGAVRHDLNIGQLIIADRLSYGDQEIELENPAIEKIRAFLAGTNFREGKLQSFKWPVWSRSKVSEDAIAVDMESFAVAQTAAKYRMPALIIKAVSDVVPEHVSLVHLLTLFRTLKSNTQKARTRLGEFVNILLNGPREYFK